jgi:DNA-binding MarR family transcriptional regulator
MNNADNLTFKNMPVDFSIIDNLLRTKGLSFKEVGLYFLLWSISDKSIILHSITELAKLGNCGTEKVKGLMDKLIEKKLLIKYRRTQQIYFFKVLLPDENYENAKREFLR